MESERSNLFFTWIADNLIWIMLVAVIGLFSLTSSAFYQPSNLVNVFLRAAPLGLLVIGQTFTLITGNLDLSAESVLGLTAMIGAMSMVPAERGGWGLMFPPVLAVILMLLVGALVGLLNGLLVTKLKMNNFIVTVAMLMIVRGLTYFMAKGHTIYDLPKEFLWLGSGTLFSLSLGGGQRVAFSVASAFLILAFAVAAIVTRYRRFGRNMYAIGGNPVAAEAAGVRVDSVVIGVYVISGVCSAIAGWLLLGRLASATSSFGAGWILYIIAAAVIGGISLFGGRGNMSGAFGGVLLWQVLDTGLNMARVSPFAIEVARGSLLLVAVFIDAVRVTYSRLLAIRRALAHNTIGLDGTGS